MMIAATVLQTVAAAVKPWSSLYSDSTAVSSAVMMLMRGATNTDVATLMGAR